MAGSRPDEGRSIEEWIALIQQASESGDYLRASDVAAQGLREHPDILRLEYQRLIAGVRAGAARASWARLTRIENSGRLATLDDASLKVEFQSLKGRLLKDQSMAQPDGEGRRHAAALAARAYELAYNYSGSCFPAINAATLWRVAGDADKAVSMAKRALLSLAQERDPYWRFATEAEARLLLDEPAAAMRALQAAVVVGSRRHDAISSTRRQLNWLRQTTGLGLEALSAMPVPDIVHWIANPDGAATDAMDLLPDLLAGKGGLIAFGALCSAIDIVAAEALLRHGAELGLVLPCSAATCREALAEASGGPMGKRFDDLLGRARSISIVTPEGDPGEKALVKLALVQSRGHALLRGATLFAPVQMLTLARGAARLTMPVDFGRDVAPAMSEWPDLSRRHAIWSRRLTKVMIFGDVEGFSKISEEKHAAFLKHIVGGFAQALESHGEAVEYAETAGDGVYIVVSDVRSAVSICRGLHEVVVPARLQEATLPSDLALRLSAHIGPVFRGLDRVTGREKFFGREVIRTARIEPITPPGETYVTEQFAAALACLTDREFRCEYVGLQPMAKGFGTCRMYALQAGGSEAQGQSRLGNPTITQS